MIKLGTKVKVTAPRSAQPKLRALFEALEVPRHSPDPDTDAFVAAPGTVTFVYVADPEALTAEQMGIAPWLEWVVDDPGRVAESLDALGIARHEVQECRAGEHPYFVAPGGLVFRLAAAMQRRTARGVAGTEEGVVLATVDVQVPPERAFRALTTDELERWWGSPDTYRMRRWSSEVRVGGRWSVDTIMGGNALHATGQFLEVDAPRKVVQTRKYEFDHPRLGRRDTTVTYRFDPIPNGTRVTVRHDGFAGLPDAAEEHAYGWERVLGWLEAYLRSEGA